MTETPPKKRIGVLSLHNSKETKAILNAIEALGHEPVWIREETLSLAVDGGRGRVEPDVDAVVNRLLLTKSDTGLADLGVVELFEDHEIPVLNPSAAVLRTTYEPAALRILADAGVSVPDTYQDFDGRSDGAGSGDRRYVRKPVLGTNGAGVSIAEEADDRPPASRRTLIQGFVDTGDRASDVRIYVVGGEVVGAMRRHAPDGDWRTNVAVGGAVENVTHDLDDGVRETAVRAVDALDLDVAGVDVIGTERDPYVLEVNATAGFKGFFEATGASPAPYIARLAIERAGGTVDDAGFADHETRLADEWPACAPDLGPDEDFRTVGYTERVDVAAGGGIATAVAKSDTGAKRTTVDLSLAAEVGAGPLEGTTSVRSGSSKSSSSRPLVTLDVRVGDRWHEVTADVIDREHMNYPVLLGRDILDDYFVNVSTRAVGDETNEE
ncbi:ATP-grasp domain-containing protein [Natrinema marinum]|uniref:ATP-grasp domain-containing protein n=1 Tax=Natrinema marinum TaxID=2961598 RepID=UPI0020C8D380|nr:ATP-grasp domain-containing protein [Natrinema marinum]